MRRPNKVTSFEPMLAIFSNLIQRYVIRRLESTEATTNFRKKRSTFGHLRTPQGFYYNVATTDQRLAENEWVFLSL